MTFGTEDRTQREARWAAEYARRLEAERAAEVALALALQCGWREPAPSSFADRGDAAAVRGFAPGRQFWHQDPDCTKLPAGRRAFFYSPAPELSRFVYTSAKLDPCATCTLGPALELALRMPAAGEHDAVHVIITCPDGSRDQHRRCGHCARLAAAAEAAGAVVHRDGDGFTVVAAEVDWGSAWPLQRAYAVHRTPSRTPAALGPHGLAAAWALRSGAPDRGASRYRTESGTRRATSEPSWQVASLIVPAGD